MFIMPENYNPEAVARLKHVNALAQLTVGKLTETIKYVSTSGNTVSFFTTADGSGTAAFTFDFPEELFLDQAGTTLVENFAWSAVTYPNSTNPNLDGKTVLVLGVRGNAATPTVKYSFVNLEKLIDTYTAADNSININGYTVAVRFRLPPTTPSLSKMTACTSTSAAKQTKRLTQLLAILPHLTLTVTPRTAA